MFFSEGAGRESNLQNHVLHSGSRVCIVPDEVFARGNLRVSSCFTTVLLGTGETRTRTILRSQSPDVLQQSVGMLFQMIDEVVERETYGALPLSYGAKF